MSHGAGLRSRSITMSARDRFFEELQRAIARGFTLGAVSMAMACGVARDMSGRPLSPAPEGAIACSEDAGSSNSCCTRLHCYPATTDACVAQLVPGSELAARLSPPQPPGSGTCICGEITGPFAPSDGATGECCYVIGTVSCVGRPLRDGDASIVAAVVARSDWA